MTVTATATKHGTSYWRGMRDSYGRRRSWLLGFLGIVLTLSAWELCSRLGLVDPVIASRPTAVAVAAVEYYWEGSGWRDVGISASEFLTGFALALLVGLPFGFMVGWWRKLDELTEPMVNFANATPRSALVPLLVVWFGIGMESKVAVVFLGAVIPILLNARAGVVAADAHLLTVSRAFEATSLQTFRTVLIPGSIPSLVTGIRLGIGHGLIGMVVGELIASTGGLGYTILVASNSFRTDIMFVALFTVSGAGVLISVALKAFENRLDRWRPKRDG